MEVRFVLLPGSGLDFFDDREITVAVSKSELSGSFEGVIHHFRRGRSFICPKGDGKSIGAFFRIGISVREKPFSLVARGAGCERHEGNNC